MTGEQLRAQRRRLGLSAAELARSAGMHPKTLQRFERGVGPLSLTSALAVAFVLAVAQGRL